MTEGDSLRKRKKSTKKDEKLKKQNKKTSKIFLEKEVMKSAPGIDQTWMIPKRMMEQVKRT